MEHVFFFLFFTLVTGPRRAFGLKLSDARVYEPQIRARLVTTAHFCAWGMSRRVTAQKEAKLAEVQDHHLYHKSPVFGERQYKSRA